MDGWMANIYKLYFGGSDVDSFRLKLLRKLRMRNHPMLLIVPFGGYGSAMFGSLRTTGCRSSGQSCFILSPS